MRSVVTLQAVSNSLSSHLYARIGVGWRKFSISEVHQAKVGLCRIGPVPKILMLGARFSLVPVVPIFPVLLEKLKL